MALFYEPAGTFLSHGGRYHDDNDGKGSKNVLSFAQVLALERKWNTLIQLTPK